MRLRGGEASGGGRLWTVQALRAVAALMVVTGHAQSAVARAGIDAGRPFARWQPIPWGASVDLFFVISGFIIVWSSRTLFGHADARRLFLERRIARVVPLYWACTALMLALLGAAAWRGGDAPPGAGAILASLLFLPWRGPDGVFPVLDLGWTLNYELAFYALFAIAIVLPPRRAAVAVVAMLAGLVLCGIAVPEEVTALHFWTRPIAIDFALGLAVGAAALDGVRLAAGARWLLAGAGLVLFCADAGGVFAVPLGVTVANGWPRVLDAGVPAALMMAGATLGPQPRLPMALRVTQPLGDASYALYLTHPFVLILGDKLLRRTALGTLPATIVVVAEVAGAILLGIAASRLVERPLTRFANRIARHAPDRHARPAPPPAPAL